MLTYPAKCRYCEVIVNSEKEYYVHFNDTHFTCAYCHKVVDIKDCNDNYAVCNECRENEE
jgi:uncharacterized C2H2 Zn-finger protein